MLPSSAQSHLGEFPKKTDTPENGFSDTLYASRRPTAADVSRPNLLPTSSSGVLPEGRREPSEVADHPVESKKCHAVLLILLSSVTFLAVGILILFSISYTSLTFGGIFISAGVVTGVIGVLGVFTRWKSLLGLYVYLVLCLFIFLAVVWVLNVTLLSDYVRVYRAVNTSMELERHSQTTGSLEDAPFFLLDSYAPLGLRRTSSETPVGAKTLVEELFKTSNKHEHETSTVSGESLEPMRQQFTNPEAAKEGTTHPTNRYTGVLSPDKEKGQALEQARWAGRSQAATVQRLERQLSLERMWELQNEEANELNSLWQGSTSRMAYRLSPAARRHLTRLTAELQLGKLKPTSESISRRNEPRSHSHFSQGSGGDRVPDDRYDLAPETGEAIWNFTYPILQLPRDNSSTGESSGHDQASGVTSSLPKMLSEGNPSRTPVTHGCVEGQTRDPEFLDKVKHTITTTAFHGILCAYSMNDFLTFRRWPYDCYSECGFGLLETGKPYEKGDNVTTIALQLYMLHVAGMDKERYSTCETYAFGTGCSIVNRNYIVIVIILLSIFLALGLCGCCIMIPFTLSRNYKLYRHYKRRAVTMVHRRLSAV
ncbi:UNVERIFIED_CONTAM: transmembrane protein, putative [Hammondia hammondi]|eukprot:XP_008888245.1 transmembrane protein, putative [Hammondia hammondi]